MISSTLSLRGRLGSIMFKKIKRWWKIKKLNRALLKQAKLDKDLPPYGYERVSDWLEKNEFNLKLQELQGHCMSQMPRIRTKSINKEI
jgi:hypothetical protein